MKNDKVIIDHMEFLSCNHFLPHFNARRDSTCQLWSARLLQRQICKFWRTEYSWLTLIYHQACDWDAEGAVSSLFLELPCGAASQVSRKAVGFAAADSRGPGVLDFCPTWFHFIAWTRSLDLAVEALSSSAQEAKAPEECEFKAS